MEHITHTKIRTEEDLAREFRKRIISGYNQDDVNIVSGRNKDHYSSISENTHKQLTTLDIEWMSPGDMITSRPGQKTAVPKLVTIPFESKGEGECGLLCHAVDFDGDSISEEGIMSHHMNKPKLPGNRKERRSATRKQVRILRRLNK